MYGVDIRILLVLSLDGHTFRGQPAFAGSSVQILDNRGRNIAIMQVKRPKETLKKGVLEP